MISDSVFKLYSDLFFGYFDLMHMLMIIYDHCLMNMNNILVELPDVSVKKSRCMMFRIQEVSLNFGETRHNAFNFCRDTFIQ